MNDDIFLIHRTVPDDTTKKAKTMVASDTAKKDSQVVGTQATAIYKAETDTSIKSTKKKASSDTTAVATSASNLKITEAQAKITHYQQIVQSEGRQSKDTAQLVPMYPPYLYHIGDKVQYYEIQLFNLDSLITSHDSVFYHKSIFREHNYTVKDIVTPERVSKGHPIWVFLVIMFVMFVLGRMVTHYKGRKSNVILSPFSRTSLKTLLNERAVNKVSVNLLIDFLYSVLLSLSEFFVIRNFGVVITGTPVLDFIVLVGVTFLFIYIRVMLVKFIGSVFNYKISTSVYILNQSICNLLCGMLLVPALLLGFYSGLSFTALLYTITAIITVMFLIRVVRGSVIMLSESQFSKIYMLYYMFVIEILPLLVIAKWIMLNV